VTRNREREIETLRGLIRNKESKRGSLRKIGPASPKRIPRKRLRVMKTIDPSPKKDDQEAWKGFWEWWQIF
jgi:hypothetical protein